MLRSYNVRSYNWVVSWAKSKTRRWKDLAIPNLETPDFKGQNQENFMLVREAKTE